MKSVGSVNNLLENRKKSEKSPESRNTLKREKSAYSNINDVDILVSSQNTFPVKFVDEQNELKQYQNGLDRRLSAPKHLRKKIVGDFKGSASSNFLKRFNRLEERKGVKINNLLKASGASLKSRFDVDGAHFKTIDRS